MAIPLPNFQYAVHYSDIENAYYDEIFSAKKNVPPDSMDSKTAGDVLKGIGLDNKDLGRFWNAVCPEATLITRQQFKLFCKYCSVFHKGLPFSAESFGTPLDPVVFAKNPATQAIGQQAVDRLLAARTNPEYQQPRVPQTIGQQSALYNTNLFGAQPRPYGQPEVAPQTQQSTYSPAPTTFQSQVHQPHAPQPTQQSPGPSSSFDSIVNQFSVTGNNASRITPEDYVLVKKVVESIPAARQDEYTFDELKSIILAFKLTNTKEATRIWKLVDPQGRRVISKEATISLFYLLAMARKGVEVPATLPQVFDNYIRTKAPPFADLGSIARTDTLATEDGGDLRSFEEAYNRATANTNASVQKYREQNADTLEKERSEVNKLRLFLAQLQAARKKISQENQRGASNIETVKQLASTGGSSADLQAFLLQIEQKSEEQKSLLKRVCGDTQRLIDREKQLEDNYHAALQKRDEYEQKLKEYEESKLAANFGADFAMPVHAEDSSPHSPHNVPDQGSPKDECHMKLAPEEHQPYRTVPQEDMPEVREDGMESIEQKVYHQSHEDQPKHDDHDHEQDMFTADATAPVEKDALDSIFHTTQQSHPEAHDDDDIFNDKQPADANAHDDEDMFGGDHGHKDKPKSPAHADQKLEDLVAKDSDDEGHHEKKKDEHDDDFFK